MFFRMNFTFSMDRSTIMTQQGKKKVYVGNSFVPKFHKFVPNTSFALTSFLFFKQSCLYNTRMHAKSIYISCMVTAPCRLFSPSDIMQKQGMNIAFQSRQLHAGLVFSRSVLFRLSFTLWQKQVPSTLKSTYLHLLDNFVKAILASDSTKPYLRKEQAKIQTYYQ